MANAIKKAEYTTKSTVAVCSFPPSAYAFDDDVTTEAVEELRKKAGKVIEKEEWEVVDGFGQVFHT